MYNHGVGGSQGVGGNEGGCVMKDGCIIIGWVDEGCVMRGG